MATPPTPKPTPETLTRHELCGLRVRVAAASNPDLVGIEGRVVTETMRTLVVESVARVDGETVRRTRRLPKRGATFEFALPTCEDADAGADGRDGSPDDSSSETSKTSTDEAAGGREAPGTASERPVETVGVRPGKSSGCEGVAYVTVDGSRLLSRPAHRTENAGDTTWR